MTTETGSKGRRQSSNPPAHDLWVWPRLRAGSALAEWLLLATLLLVLGGAIGWYLYSQYRTVDSQERKRLSNQAQTLEKNLAPQLLLANRVIEGILHDIPSWRAQNDGFKAANRQLKGINNTLLDIRPISVIAADGHVIASSEEALLGMNFSQSDYFQTAVKDPDPAILHVSAPYKTVLDTLVISLFRAITGPHGEFAGIVIVTAVPEYFSTLLDSIRYSPSVRAAIVHGDGRLFLSSPPVAGILGMDLTVAGSFFTLHRQSNRPVSLLVGAVRSTGEERMMALRTIQLAAPPMDKPLIAAVGRDLQSIFAPWRQDVHWLGGMFGVVVLIAVGSLFLYQRRRQEAGSAEYARKVGEDQLSLFYAQDIVGMTITSPKKGWIRVNEHLCSMLEYSEQELRALTWAQVTHPDDLAADVEQFDRLLAHEIDGYRMEKRFVTRSGGTVSTNLVVRCVRAADGDVDFVTAVVEDITERKKVEAALRESEQRYRTMVEWTPEPIAVHRGYTILYANPAAIKMFGASCASDLTGTSLLDRAHPDCHQIAMSRTENYGNRGLDVPMLELKMLRMDGAVIDVEIQGTAIFYDGERVRQSSMRDISARKAVEAALEAARL
ncbi:MAG: PAS domain-containing protein, partial [Rhodoferax sp.]